MSKVYRALEKLEREKLHEKREGPFLEIPEVPVPPAGPERVFSFPEDRPEPFRPPAPRARFLIPPLDSYAAEQFRKLRTQLFLKCPHPPHAILVTSALPREGKTSVSVNLAFAIAQDLQKTAILVDGDLRKPGIPAGGVKETKGLSTYLSQNIALAEILLKSVEESLWMIPAGPPTNKPSELLGSQRMKDLLLSLKEFTQGSYVIIDSPPILSASESVLLSKLVDAVVLVIMADSTSRESVRRAIQSIDQQKILGVVLNQMNLNTSSYYARYRYGYTDYYPTGRKLT